MKTVELFCASPASTAICTSMNQHAMVRHGTTTTTPRHRHHRRSNHHDYYQNHYQFDFGDKPKFKTPTIPCTSQQHIDPKPYSTYNHQKTRKSTTTTGSSKTNTDQTAGPPAAMVVRRKSCADASDLKTPRGSSRYLLRDNQLFVETEDSDEVSNASALVVSEPVWPSYNHDDSPVLRKSSSTSYRFKDSPVLNKSKSSLSRSSPAAPQSPVLKSSKPGSRDQVVELRVSIHCKGCEGKVRKHLARMEGVRSFHIDLESKKVTVVGDVTPLTVLSSISKVKNAQFWPSPSNKTTPSSSPSPLLATIRY